VIVFVLTYIGLQALGVFVVYALYAHRDEPPLPGDEQEILKALVLAVLIVIYAQVVLAAFAGYLVNCWVRAPIRMLEELRKGK
jgi:hypothetical protein